MLRLLKRLSIKEWSKILASAVLIVLQVWLELKIPEYTNSIMGHISTASANPDAVSLIWQQGGLMLACAIGSLVSAVIVGLLSAKVAASFSARMRMELFNKVEDFSMAEINNFSTASLITRSTNDISQVQMLVAMGMQLVIKTPVMAVWAIVKILGKSWQWSVATAIAVAALLIMVVAIVLIVEPKFKKMQILTDNLNNVTRENLTGLRVVKAYNAEAFQEEKFKKANDELTATGLFTHRVMGFMSPCMNIVMNGLTLAIFLIGAFLIGNSADILRKAALFGDMVEFSSYAMMVVMAFMMLTMIFVMLPRAAVSAKRINEVLETKSTIVDGEGAVTDIKGEVEFRNVSFKYEDSEAAVLENISFTAKKGQTVAFIGATGSGKSTLINLVPRFYDATEGEVLVDGINVKQYKLSELHDKIGYVPQRGVLFSGTVASNLTYGSNGKSITDEQINSALEVSQATDFVSQMDSGVQSAIAQGGTNVSGGQKQRLSIARAVCRNPEIYIFDDSFSALDYKTDRQVRSALKKYTADATSLIVAQRIGTIKNADVIVVLEEGKIAGIGKHKQLLKTCKVYKEIALSQLSEEELK